MGLKEQKNIALGLLSTGMALLTGFSLSAYGQWILFFGIVLMVAIILAFFANKDAVELKGKVGKALKYMEAVKITGSFYGLIFLGFMVVVIIGTLKGFPL